ncbi:DUF2267 domain-containing protein [Actinomadura flavalba]|uniref:DUF2267 domain-containing protein n=1 Tax=Actinomadura flavalba TaxID=1120938 RepID=UPI0003764859|nr:DUF2267 domain-containing protein [Actinomadura flavalba]
MAYGEFIATVRELGDYDDREEAERVTVAVLRVVRSRMTPEGVDHLAAQLPEPLDALLRGNEGPVESYGVEEFVRRVAEETGGHEITGELDASAVLTTVAGTITGGELNHVLSQLPSGFAPLFGKPDLSD